jgi:hypothetical protein
MENISLSIINLRVNKEMALAAQQTYLNKSPFFQRLYESWDDKMKTRFMESILLRRATNPIWTVLNEEDDSEEILDGMHRITTALSYLNNEFPIQGKYLSTLDGEKYNKKYFNDLDSDDKAKIRNYNFIFNKLDSSYRTDLNKLKDMYEILNRSSRTLNDYEYNKVILQPFYDIISKSKDVFMRTGFFSKKVDSRGNIDTEIIEMIALSSELPSCWSSFNYMKDEWIKNNIGETTEQIESFSRIHGEEISNKLNFMAKIIDCFYLNGLISKNIKNFKQFYLPYKIIVSRCCFLIPNIAMFNRISSEIIAIFKKEITEIDIQSKLECKSRNATFQKKLTGIVDEIILAEMNKEGSERRFSKKMITEKMAIQNNICPMCKLSINENEHFEADHIVPWTSGGSTTLENLQILHKRCHHMKK